MLAAAVTGVLYAAGDAWMWHHWKLVGGLASAAAANSALRFAPAVVRRYPRAFTAAGDERASRAFESRPLTGAPRTDVPWPSAGQVQVGRRRARLWALRRVGVSVVPASVALSVAAWATAGVDRLPESDVGFMLVLAAWTVLICVAVLAGFSCDRGTVRALYPGRAAAARVVGVTLTRRPVSDAWGRRRRLVCDVRAVVPDGRLVEFTLRTRSGPAPGDVVLLVGNAPRSRNFVVPTGHRAGPRWCAVAVLAGRPRATLYAIRHVLAPADAGVQRSET
jgi:hypothetical protein